MQVRELLDVEWTGEICALLCSLPKRHTERTDHLWFISVAHGAKKFGTCADFFVFISCGGISSVGDLGSGKAGCKTRFVDFAMD